MLSRSQQAANDLQFYLTLCGPRTLPIWYPNLTLYPMLLVQESLKY